MHFWPVGLCNWFPMQYTVAGYARLKLQAYTAHSCQGLIHDMDFTCLMSSIPCCIYSRSGAFMYCWCMQGTVTDTAGKVNLAVSSLSFTRVAYPLLSGTSYEVIKSPGLLTLT